MTHKGQRIINKSRKIINISKKKWQIVKKEQLHLTGDKDRNNNNIKMQQDSDIYTYCCVIFFYRLTAIPVTSLLNTTAKL